MGIGAAWN
jgi:alkanesulfonate monooxygenase SsuD/methylene tetrahydromethanopterin reductase-like flavin-dependent oxidoreductase (luciferase family)